MTFVGRVTAAAGISLVLTLLLLLIFQVDAPRAARDLTPTPVDVAQQPASPIRPVSLR